MDATELEKIKERRIDFQKFAPAANKTVFELVQKVNNLIEVVQFQDLRIKELEDEKKIS